MYFFAKITAITVGRWNSFDTETQRVIFFSILITSGILAAYGAIKVLIDFLKLDKKEKINKTVLTIIILGAIYLYFLSSHGALWGIIFFVGIVVFFLIINGIYNLFKKN